MLLQWEDFAQANAGRCSTATATGSAPSTTTSRAPPRSRPAPCSRRWPSPAGGCATSGSSSSAPARPAAGSPSNWSRPWSGKAWPSPRPAPASGCIDRPGLLHDGLAGLRPFQQRFAQPKDRVAGWRTGPGEAIGLLDVVRNVRPTILIGASGQPGTFTEAIVRAMAEHVDRPIIFPLSNPTSRAEATPADLIAWTDGRALIATGSPFDDVSYGGRRFPIAQCNNSYIFPGLGLGVLAVGARRVTDAMFMAAARALADCSRRAMTRQARCCPRWRNRAGSRRDRPGRRRRSPA